MGSRNLLLLLVFLATCGQLSSVRLPKVVELESRGISSFRSIDKLLQNRGQISHAWAQTEDCFQEHELNYESQCGAPISSLLQRMTHPSEDYLQVMFLHFLYTDCNAMLPDLKFTLNTTNYASMWIGIRLPSGPKHHQLSHFHSQCVLRQTNGGIIPNKHVIVMMFMEHETKYLMHGYSEQQLKDMSIAFNKSDAQYVALDALYASNTNFSLFTEYLFGIPVILYQLRYQPLPHITKLRKAYDSLYESSTDVFLMLPRPVINRLLSFLPTVDWTMKPFKWGLTLKNNTEYYQFLKNPQTTFAHLLVQVRNDTETISRGKVSLARVLLGVSPKKRVLLEYIPEEANQHGVRDDFHKYLTGETNVYVLLRAAEGPNYEPNYMNLVDLSNFTLLDQPVTYFLGFREKLGRDKEYSTAMLKALAEIMLSPKFIHKPVGIFLQAEFLCHSIHVETLTKVENLKYAVIKSEDNFNPEGFSLYILQHNIKRLGLETILHMPEKLTKKMYNWPVEQFSVKPEPVEVVSTMNWRVALIGWGTFLMIVCLAMFIQKK